MTTYATSSYRANQVLTASSPQLIVMLYDGARRFLYQASVAMREREIELAHNKLRAAERILRHLRNTLDLSQGEIAANLNSIYDFCLRQAGKARFEQDPAKLEQINAMLGQLRDSWAEIAATHAEPPAGDSLAVAGVAG